MPCAPWANLNGPWEFRFDPMDPGFATGGKSPARPDTIARSSCHFPGRASFPASNRSKMRPRSAGIAAGFSVPTEFPSGLRVWLRFGAVDWRADVWVNGRKVAEHEGGYTPFEADISDTLDRGGENIVVVRAFDPTDPAVPTGKQVGWYTPSSGIWQTVWLEARPKTYLAGFRITTQIQPAKVQITVDVAGLDQRNTRSLSKPRTRPSSRFPSRPSPRLPTTPMEPSVHRVRRAGSRGRGTPAMDSRDPQPLRGDTQLKDADGKVIDSIETYFGLRTIRRGKYGDEPFERILFNGKPLYLRAALDQSFNPEGIYTAPDDGFLKRDMIIAKMMGLKALRIHIKPDEPRRLYWADQIGVLILEDMPNTWRQTPAARRAWEQTMRESRGA